MNKLDDKLKMKKLLKISISIICIVFISGCTGEYNAEIEIKEIEDIGNGTYFEITDDELKEYPELIRSISGEKFIESDYSSCELNSDEFERLSDFFRMKHREYLFSIDMKFENNLNDNIIDAELMNTFESNGFPLSEKYSITKGIMYATIMYGIKISPGLGYEDKVPKKINIPRTCKMIPITSMIIPKNQDHRNPFKNP